MSKHSAPRACTESWCSCGVEAFFHPVPITQTGLPHDEFWIPPVPRISLMNSVFRPSPGTSSTPIEFRIPSVPRYILYPYFVFHTFIRVYIFGTVGRKRDIVVDWYTIIPFYFPYVFSESIRGIGAGQFDVGDKTNAERTQIIPFSLVWVFLRLASLAKSRSRISKPYVIEAFG